MPSGRPRVLVNCAISLDGKLHLAPAHRAGPFVMSRGPEDHRRMRALRGRADAVVIGAENLRVDDPDLALPDDERTRRRHTGIAEPLRVVVTRAGQGIDASRAIFDRGRGGESVVAHAQAVPAERRVVLSKVATLLDLGATGASVPPSSTSGSPSPWPLAGGIEVRRLLDWLARERGCHTVLVEGGGGINASFFAARAVDELFATLVPRVLGGKDAPTLADGPGMPDGWVPDARLIEMERLGEELYLHYAIDWG